jgi:sterol desaturase/sphingolipid hydroxylase (fatty acid hydroxylase superfamily)
MSAPIALELFAGFVLFALVYAPLERLFPTRRQPALRSGWKMDIAYYAVGCFVGHVSDAMSVGGMLLLRQASGFNFGHLAAGQPAWLQFFEIVLLADFLAYCFHRAMHQVPLLWRVHRVHHTSLHMDWLANVRLHPLDKIMGDCFQFIPIFALGFGAGPVLAYTIFLGFQGFFNHSNIRFSFGPLRWVIANPQFHHWHHCNDLKYLNRNFSPHLVIFDHLFGTFYLPPDRREPDSYGIPEEIPERFWEQMISPLR